MTVRTEQTVGTVTAIFLDGEEIQVPRTADEALLTLDVTTEM